jgi:uncharacterized membrane protein YqgA involved in biofilm formation
MIGVFANTVLVFLGSLVGLLLKRGIPENIKKIVMIGLGLFTCVFGIKMGLEMEKPLIGVVSLVLGGAFGELLRIEAFLEGLGTRLKRYIKTQDETSFAQGFVTASLLFCVGPMTILGCLQAGLENNPGLLFIKSLMDGVSSVILCSTLGIGVMFSAVFVLVFQGLLTLLAQQVNFLTEPIYLNDFTSVGGIMIFAIGIKLLGIKQIKVGNFLPALVFVLFFVFLSTLF